MLGVFLARNLAGPLYTIWLNEQITDSSVRATVISISGPGGRDRPGRRRARARRDRQRVGHPRRRLPSGALAIAPALALYGRARSATAAASPSSRSCPCRGVNRYRSERIVRRQHLIRITLLDPDEELPVLCGGRASVDDSHPRLIVSRGHEISQVLTAVASRRSRSGLRSAAAASALSSRDHHVARPGNRGRRSRVPVGCGIPRP